MIPRIRDAVRLHWDRRKSDRLYRLVPWGYIGAGLVTISQLFNLMGVFSGGILIITGVIILNRRYKYRWRQAAEAAAEEKENSRRQPLINLVWRPAFNSGYGNIDQQHQNLFNDAHVLLEAITSDRLDSDFNEGLRTLLTDIQTHFRDEEKMLEHLDPGVAASHKKTHKALFERTQSIVRDMLEKKISPQDLLCFLIFDVITNHLLKEDVKWQKMLKNN